MKKPIFTLLLLISCFNANASHFRGINIGGSCSDIEAYEIKQGSEKSNFKVGTVSYNGNVLGRSALINYFCENGIFERGTYHISFDNYEEAKQFFLNNKPYFIEVYGQPDIDGSTIEYSNYYKKLNIELEEHEKQILNWKKSNASITFSAMLLSIHSGDSSVSINVKKNLTRHSAGP